VILSNAIRNYISLYGKKNDMRASARPVRARLLLVPVLAGALAVMAACSSQAGSSASSTKPVRGGQLVVAIDAQPTGFDPATADDPSPGAASVSNEIFSTLTVPTASGTYAPYLAKSVQGNSDDSVWTITLRPGMEFADGTPINAAAIEYNLARIKATGADYTQVKTFQVTSPLTLVITLNAPWSAFPASLSGQPGWIASPAALKSEGKGFATKPVGSGPYELSSWSQGNQIVLVPNPHFWRKGLPYLTKVTYKIITDSSARLSALQAGNVDMAEVDPAQAAAQGINTSSQYKTYDMANGIDLVYFNTGVAPLNNILARRAVAEATNRPALITSIWRGVGSVANSPMSSSNPFYTPVNFPGFNLQQAKQLVQQYQQATGKPLALTLSSSNDPTQELEAQALQSMWQAAGIKVTLAAPQEAGTYSETVIGKKYEAAIFGFPSILDPDQWYTLIWTPQGVLNVANYKNATIGTAIVQAAQATTVQGRRAQYAIVNNEIAQQVYSLFIHSSVNEIAARSNVQGLNTLTLPDGTKAPFGQEFQVFSVETMWLG
jgi:peptide/nickel transport system substrate-binding protein